MMFNAKMQIRKGPLQAITCQPPHDRPIFALAIGEKTFVTGSADHGLREYQIQNGKHIRELFNKKYGHKEWVSTCAYTPSGKIISGGMDSVVCFWQSKSVKCDHFLGHEGSISKVMGNDSLGISASYDATIILWDFRKKQQSQKLLGPHKQAILQFEWHNSLLVSGDKVGVMGIWDLNQGVLVRAIKSHKGAISNIKFDDKSGLIITTGLNDGSIVGFDMRSNSAIHKQMIHKGSVNSLKIVGELATTCSADSTIKILTLPDFEIVKSIDGKDMLMTLEQGNGVLFAGTGKGNVLAYELKSGQCLYGYGAIKKGGCRFLGFNKECNRLVCAGQDDSATILMF